MKSPADIVVAEILDTGLIGEGMLISLEDARSRGLIKKVTIGIIEGQNAVVIPSSARVFAQIIDSAHFSKKPLQKISGFDLSSFNLFYTNDKNYEVINLNQVPFTEVTEPAEIFRLY